MLGPFVVHSREVKALCTPSGHEIHHYGDDGEEDQQVNRQAADVHNEKAADPEDKQNNCKDEIHGRTFFLVQRMKSDAEHSL